MGAQKWEGEAVCSPRYGRQAGVSFLFGFERDKCAFQKMGRGVCTLTPRVSWNI